MRVMTIAGMTLALLAACGDPPPPAPPPDAAADHVLKTQADALKAAEAMKAQMEREAAERERALQEMTGR